MHTLEIGPQGETSWSADNAPLASQVGGSHYKDLAIQPAEYCQRNRLGFLESNAIKYVTRHRAKNGRQDIEKAIHCLQLLLEIEYGEQTAREPLQCSPAGQWEEN